MYTRVAVSMGLVLAAVTSGCGGAGSERPDPSPVEVESRDACRPEQALELQLVEDFEFRRAADWWVSTDATPGAELEPNLRKSPTATEIEGGRCGTSRYALRLRARGLEIYGGAFGINFFLQAEDASAWDGVAFWARRGSDSGRSLFVSVSDKYTDENSGGPLQPEGKPFCFEQTERIEDKCDRFGAGVGLNAEWHHYLVPFADMKQRGFGKVAPALDTEALVGLSFGFEVGDWDIWVDDVAFFRRTPRG